MDADQKLLPIRRAPQSFGGGGCRFWRTPYPFFSFRGLSLVTQAQKALQTPLPPLFLAPRPPPHPIGLWGSPYYAHTQNSRNCRISIQVPSWRRRHKTCSNRPNTCSLATVAFDTLLRLAQTPPHDDKLNHMPKRLPCLPWSKGCFVFIALKMAPLTILAKPALYRL